MTYRISPHRCCTSVEAAKTLGVNGNTLRAWLHAEGWLEYKVVGKENPKTVPVATGKDGMTRQDALHNVKRGFLWGTNFTPTITQAGMEYLWRVVSLERLEESGCVAQHCAA